MANPNKAHKNTSAANPMERLGRFCYYSEAFDCAEAAKAAGKKGVVINRIFNGKTRRNGQIVKVYVYNVLAR